MLQVFSGPITDVIGHMNVIIVGMLAYTARMLGYSFITDPTYVFPFEALVNLFYFYFDSRKRTHSRCPKSERSVWKTKRNLVRISDIQISDIGVILFLRSFGYTINVRNLNIWLVESINRMSEIRTK